MRKKTFNSLTRIRPTRMWLLAVVLATALSAIAGVAFASSGSGQPPVSAESPETTTVEGFAILNRARTAADNASGYVAEFHGANMALARRAQGFTTGEAWVAPRTGSVCLVAESTTAPNGGAVCDEDSAALTGRMAFYATNPKVPGVVFVAGLVPDGVTDVVLHVTNAAGSDSTETLPVHENVYMAEVQGSVSTISESGSLAAVSLPINAQPAN